MTLAIAITLLQFACLAWGAPLADKIAESRIAAIGAEDLLPIKAGLKASTKNSYLLDIVPPEVDGVPWKIRPLRIGRARVEVHDAAGKLVEAYDYEAPSSLVFDNYRSVHTLLRDVPGIALEIVDNQIVIRGKPEHQGDAEKILQVQAAYVDHVLNLAVDSQRLCETRICRHDPPTETEYWSLDSIPLVDPSCLADASICNAVRSATDKIIRDKEKSPQAATNARDNSKAVAQTEADKKH